VLDVAVTTNEERIKLAITYLTQVANDTGVPRNIREACKRAISLLNDKKLPSLAARAANAINTLDELMQEPTMPIFARPTIWKAISLLEQIRD
jgi:uncharacterized protein (UPF0147 family)